jgi:hypothetical protein
MNGLARLIPSKAEAVVRVVTSGIGRADIVSGVCIDRFHTNMNVGQRACRWNGVRIERYVVQLSNGKHQFTEWGDSYTRWAHEEMVEPP